MKDVPDLGAKLSFGEGKTWAGTVGLSTRVLFLLAGEGRVVRGRPVGSWVSSQYRWAPTETWLGPLPEVSPDEARHELVGRWLRSFGPGTLADLAWWTGWRKGETAKVLARIGAVEVDLAADPAGQARSDWRIFADLARTIARRAEERGLEAFPDGRGGQSRYADLWSTITLDGALASDEAAVDEILRDSALSGNLPQGTSLASVREQGWVRPERLPRVMAAMCGADVREGEPFVALRHHAEDAAPYGTLTSRAQFYIDHTWFFEADEHLPRHKAVPLMGGDYPLQLTGGHPRWSIHSTNTTSRRILQTTRGGPVVHLNPADAEARGISGGEAGTGRPLRLLGALPVLRVEGRHLHRARDGEVAALRGRLRAPRLPAEAVAADPVRPPLPGGCGEGRWGSSWLNLLPGG